MNVSPASHEPKSSPMEPPIVPASSATPGSDPIPFRSPRQWTDHTGRHDAGPLARFEGFRATTRTSHLPAKLVEPIRSFVAKHVLDTGGLPGSIAVTSALHGEGVSTVCDALATVIADDQRRSVCRLDLSWAVSRSVAPVAQVGIFELVTGQTSADDVLGRAAPGDVVRLGGGKVPPEHRDALVHSQQLEVLIAEVARRFDTVVLDLPPLLGGSAGLATMRFADAHLLVVRQGVTTVSQMESAVRSVDSVPSFGVVLNRYRSRLPERVARLFV